MSAALLRTPFTVIDGGLSTALQELGEEPSGLLWTAAALIDRPHAITAAHRLYVDAGADVVITASYQASVPGFMGAGVDETTARRLLASTTSVARASGASVVACSVGPYGACLGDGSEYHGRYAASWDDVRAFHRARLEVLVSTGPDVFAIETIPSAAEAEIVVEELRALTDAPAWVSFSCVDDVHTCSGDALADAVARVAPAVTAVGLNCTAPRHVESL
ncbi:MAG TPA: homocysteine S-methyltransferase, partial [Ilumatobacteraceae bacterium]|nr:homocysteine S-methyltransferase [Ilumatobacteraceae bacterium]